ncbi:MAG: phosphoribosylformylglycinamidine cyclo-ligase [Acidobacteria bacterium]|nr:phosphoribosylformylglycinamidine cyclo-ligase [Acidobacteriota bacterium]NIO59596.1 phosphoribosylformylglycinamidine cyclo-ligase [Acidobacteriota bacterium]NIQ30619.1 phosphoribosylformylglycinamidine cyclo-ligase [Acidobacteriota bacterium]NIT11302.1 phosphoribosylformylglycinamidine cyclo-ligase [Acidobacteriota bacterium]
MEKKGLTYRDAGVDIDAQDEALRRIKELVESTRTAGVLADLGSFGGLFRPPIEGLAEPVLVASADGVGTKLKAAFASGIHDTVGRDLVNHCVNDILVQGARPLFFLDYVATGRLEPGVLASVVEGLAAGCRENGCALLGGETAEMPGFYADGEYDVAGFIVGLVDRGAVLDGSAVREGDLLIGLPSSGMHTNGFSLARKILFEIAGLGIDDPIDELGETVGEVLLAEHKSYLPALSGALGRMHALAHITGGGLTDNLPRVLPDGCAVRIDRAAWEVPALYRYLATRGGVEEDEMFRTFNMGIGMVAIVAPDEAAALERHLDEQDEAHLRIGEVVSGDQEVRYV